MSDLLDPTYLIQTGGIVLVGSMIFAESGLLIGFFLPGDTLLLSAGFFAGSGKLNLPLLLLVIFIAAVAGDNVGYTIGRRTGHKLFSREKGKIFHKDHLLRAESFYKQHGGKTIILARFIPVIRTFAPMAAGMGKMPRQQFVLFNLIGAFTWGVGVTMIGYVIAKTIGEYIDIEKYLLLAVSVAVLATFGGAIFHILRDAETRRELYGRIFSPRRSK